MSEISMVLSGDREKTFHHPKPCQVTDYLSVYVYADLPPSLTANMRTNAHHNSLRFPVATVSNSKFSWYFQINCAPIHVVKPC